jgi:hypothetical protein
MNRFANRHRLRPTLLALEERAVPTVVTFQDGVEGTTDGVLNGFLYAGTEDAEIQSANPNTNFGDVNSVSIDSQDAAGLRQALLRFDDIFGPSKSQVPFGAAISKATLTLWVTSSTDKGGEVGLYRMRQPWSENTVTANSFLPIPGVQTDGIEAESFRDWNLPDNKVGSNFFIDADVTSSLKAWATGTTNFGWLVDQTGVNGWDFNTSETTNIPRRPMLTVEFAPLGGKGGFQFAQGSYALPEPDVGSVATTLLVTRTGGLEGTVSVDYTLTPIPGSATPGEDYDDTVTTGTLTFGPNVTNQPLQIKLLGDTKIEGPEAFKIVLSNPQGGATINAAETTVNIVDNDLLLNEIVANHTGIADDGYEYVEITGAPGLTIPAGTYLTAFNSDVTTPVGNLPIAGGIGTALLVVDLSGQKIGSNGLLIVTPTNFKYTIPSATTRVIATQLDAPGGGIYDGSISFALVYSPDEALVQGVDYDASVGDYVDDATPFLNDGVLDVAPFVPQVGKATAVFLDSVGSTRGPNGRPERVVNTVRPGIRVTIPDDHNVPGEVARFVSDGYTRVKGDRQANNTGSWYNGELLGDTVIYSPGNFSSGRTPPGGQVTPGDENLPRGITFAVSQVSVSETAGTVTIFVNRSGDDSVATSVEFATADGTAVAGVGQDYIAQSGKLEFGVGINQQPITITINNDSDPEGFESFFVNLTNPGAPFVLVTSQAKITIIDDDAQVATFQDGDLVGEYAGTRDVGLYGWLANDKLGGDLTTSVDRNDDDPTLSNDLEKPNQALIRFDDIFGTGPGQVPFGSTIFGAFITFNVIDASNASTKITLHRMLADWSEFSASFANPAVGVTNGVTYDDVEARVVPDGVVPNAAQLGLVDVQLSVDTIQAWALGTAPNYGWTVQSDSSNGWDIDMSDQIGPARRPKLTLVYSPPGGEGTVRFEEPSFTVNEDAGSATLVVQRPGATTGTLTVNWAITGGTATAADYTGPSSGTLIFGPTDKSLPITIPIVNDALLETNETLVFTLSGTGVDFTRDTATLVIRDNDFVTSGALALLNEFYSNPSGNDNPFEYAELVGTPGAAMGNLYMVALRGDANVFSGNADVVMDLSAFTNGANGYTVVRGANGFPTPAGTTVVIRSAFDTEDNFENSSNSFLLIYSPRATIAEGYDFDWGNDGTLSLPDGAVVIDAVGFIQPASGGKVYGGNELVQPYTPQAISRVLGDTTPNTAGWFRGTTIAPNDSLTYSATNNTNLPVIGAALTPGGPNTAPAAPLTALTAVTIDNGSIQRSMVRSVTLTFANPIQFFSSSAIGLTDQSNNPVGGVTVSVAGQGTNTLTVTFSGPAVIGNSLPDGLYRLSVNGQLVYSEGRTVDANNDGNPGSAAAIDFHRLFGDADGDRDVDATDFGAFRTAFGGSNFIFDFDGDGDVDAADFGQFRGQFGASI